ncbi:phage tail tape measure protein [Rhodococcus sp. UNC363MFTsu5.1]|uniref:phage tail tape measure protein n=1 Tax=Rhodococcus sp. UNC363MFTsu5.1 TaxID=1449069 RepID=UPI0012DBF56F|nr:phage tail tape measure protein [Rhodococcus sp. UNC363MFTsu5.1]
MADEDVVWVPVLPSMDKFGAAFLKGAGGVGRSAGQQISRDLSDGIASGKASVEKATDVLAKATDKVADAAGRARVAEAQYQALLNKGVTDAGRLAAAKEKVAAAQRKEIAALRDADKATSALATAQERAAAATDEVAASTTRAGGGFKSMFAGLDTGAKKLAAFTAGAAGVAGAADLIGKSMSREADISKMNAAMGATGAIAKEHGDAAGKLYAAGLGASMSDVTRAVDVVGSSFDTLGFEGEASLEQATSRAMNFSKVFDTDIASSVQTASQLVQDGLAKDSTEAFDLMTKSFQSVPAAMRDELPEILQEYGTNFRALGFEGPETFNLLASAAEKGKFALDKTGDALKEFTIRGSDMSKTSVDAYKLAGVGAEDMAAKIAQGGDAAQQALQQTATGLLSIEDPVERSNAAIALFGTPLEDLSVDQIPQFLSALTGADNIMGDFAGSTDRMGETLNDNALSKMETFKRGLESKVVGVLGDDVLPMLGEFSTALKGNEGSLLGALAATTGFGGAFAGLEQAKSVLGSVRDGVGSVRDGLVSTKDTAVATWSKVSDAGSWVATQAKATGSFVATSASATTEAAKTSASWVGSQAKAGAGWAATQAKAAGSFVATSASATVEAVKSSAAWVASNTRTAVSFVATKGAMAATTIATGAMTAAQWLLNAALNANPIGLIIVAITALVAAVVLAYKKSETFRNIVQGAWQGIQAAVSFAWDNVLRPALESFTGFLVGVGEKATWLYNNAIKPAFDGISSTVSWVYDNVLSPILGKAGDAFSGLGAAAGGVADAIRGSFSGIVDILKAPIRMIGQLLAALPDKIGPFSVPGVSSLKSWGQTLQALRSGGPVAGRRANGLLFGPGTGTSDSVVGLDAAGVPTARVSAGEWVTPEHAVNAKTIPFLEALRNGWVPSADFLRAMVAGDLVARLPGRAEGGRIDEAMAYAHSMDPTPYLMGGFGPGGIDCSAFVAAVVNTAMGLDPYDSRMSTVNEGDWLTAKGAQIGRGGDGDLRIGWYDNGGGAYGHTAGTFPDGTNFESNGSDGVIIGGPTGWDDPMFTDHAFFPGSMFLGGDPGLDGNIFGGEGGTGGGTAIGTNTSPSTSGGTTSPIGTATSPSTSGGTTSPSTAMPSSTSSGVESLTLKDQIGKTAAGFATETTGDVLEFFGLGKLMDLPIMPVSQPAPEIAPNATGGPGQNEPAPPPAAPPQGPLVWIENLMARDDEDAANAMGREARRLVRSDALLGGWGD